MELDFSVKQLMSQPFTKNSVATAICSVVHEGVDNGLTAGWVSFVNFDPLRVMVSIGVERHTHDMIKNGKNFGLSYLTKDQKKIAQKFSAVSGKTVKKFEQDYLKEKPEFEFFRPGEGRPYLFKQALVSLDCEVENIIPLGDHTVFIGKVLKSYIHPDQLKAKAIDERALHCVGVTML